jgi:mono/diheme cytochrome c family protein
MLQNTLATLLLISLNPMITAAADWSENHPIPLEGRPNPLSLPEVQWQQFVQAGRLHAQIYPVKVTGLLPPFAPVAKLLPPGQDFEDIERDLGLHPYPKDTDEGVYQVPYPDGQRPEHRLGMGWIERGGASGFTFSCAACHSSRLFGTTVLGMTNRFPKANDFFVRAKSAVALIPASLVESATGATEAEMALFKETKSNIRFVGVKKPVVLGLDTSLAQVALSLNLRAPDPWAEKDPEALRNPPRDWLDEYPADSKPAVWWNVKYKNRWLSDGSVVSGNPIFTNILWNELGRGADLRELNQWFRENPQTIAELASAVFASEAPRFTDFFPAEKIDLARARAGELIYEKTCSRCHGHYFKNWDLLPESAPLIDKLKTWKVQYHSQTPVKNVGTDPHRWMGMQSLLRLNELLISQEHGIQVRPQQGYVPPPLVGIWARWPYFHNNSAPSLCAVLTAGPQRPKIYWAVQPDDPATDFDLNCNGYPTNLPWDRRKADYKYDSRKTGMNNRGHDEGIFLKDGREVLSAEDKKNLIQFLQTL